MIEGKKIHTKAAKTQRKKATDRHNQTQIRTTLFYFCLKSVFHPWLLFLFLCVFVPLRETFVRGLNFWFGFFASCAHVCRSQLFFIMYAELHAKTNFSFLEGASHPDELVGRAAELHYAALAVTDRNSLAGVVRAHQAAKEAGLKLLIGAEITPEDAPPVVLWATDRAAYGRLSRLITRGRRRAEKGQCRLTLDDVAEHAAGLLAGVIVEFGMEQGNKGAGEPA